MSTSTAFLRVRREPGRCGRQLRRRPAVIKVIIIPPAGWSCAARFRSKDRPATAVCLCPNPPVPRADAGTSKASGLECSLLSTRENHPDRGFLPLRPERRPILVFKNEAAGRAYRKRIEDTFVSLTCNRADLATFSIDETN